MPGINQVQVNPKAGLTFASALRSILRSDPDVVLLGEIRDHETAQIAIEASLTGHLVLSTLHTNDAPSAVTRLIEMDIEPFLVGSALDCVVAQRLARRLCDRCKRAVPARRRTSSSPCAFGSTPAERSADAVPAGRLLELLQHRLPRPHRAARGHDRHRGDRAARRRARLERRDRHDCAIAQGMLDAAPGRLGEGAARHSRRSKRSCGWWPEPSSEGAMNQPIYEIPVSGAITNALRMPHRPPPRASRLRPRHVRPAAHAGVRGHAAGAVAPPATHVPVSQLTVDDLVFPDSPAILPGPTFVAASPRERAARAASGPRHPSRPRRRRIRRRRRARAPTRTCSPRCTRCVAAGALRPPRVGERAADDPRRRRACGPRATPCRGSATRSRARCTAS